MEIGSSLAYMAGIVDAEGCIAIAKDRYRKRVAYRLQVSIANTDRILLDGIKSEFGGFICTVKRPNENWRQGYQWYLTGGNATKFLESISPYLIAKYRQADLAVNFWNEMTKLPSGANDDHEEVLRRIKCFDQMRLLNLKGRDVPVDATMLTRGKFTYSHEKYAYLAGIVDGDGCVAITRGMSPRKTSAPIVKHELRLSVGNTNKSLLEWLRSTYGGRIQFDKQQRHGGWKTCGVWAVGSDRAVILLELIEPFLRLKGQQCQIAYGFAKMGLRLSRAASAEQTCSEISRRDVLYQEMRALNQRGNTAATTNQAAPAVLSGEVIV